jgi:glycosyltransferase involved in cell wall biosynthesis
MLRDGEHVLSNKISVVMPAYNEAVHILDNLRETVATMESLGRPYEVILVDDGSPDDTYHSASRALAENTDNVKVVRYHRNAGKGNALMCGFRYCTGEIVVFLDADMDLHPAQIPRLIEPIDAGFADVVVGSKWHPKSDVNYPFVRKAWSTGYSFLVKLLFGLPLRDTQTGLKAFRAAVLARVFPRVLAKRFAFDVEVLVNAHHLGYRIVDVPVSLRFKRGTFGRVGIADVWDVFVDTLAIFYRLQITRYYDAVGEAAARNAVDPNDVELYVGERESEVINV